MRMFVQILFAFSAPCMTLEVWQAPLRRETRADDLPGAAALVFQPYTGGLYSFDSGRTKIFAHSDLQYAPYIAALEIILKVDPGTTTSNPFRLPVTTQLNIHDGGYHVIANSRSLADFVLSFNFDEGGVETSLEKWDPPTSTPPVIRLFRKNFAAEVERLPNYDDDVDSDDDPLTVADAAEASKPFLDLS
jgi:hypothetical protein